MIISFGDTMLLVNGKRSLLWFTLFTLRACITIEFSPPRKRGQTVCSESGRNYIEIEVSSIKSNTRLYYKRIEFGRRRLI